METDEACSETAGDRILSPRLRVRNDPNEATRTRPNDFGHGATNRGESVSVPSAISILTSLKAKFKEGSFLCMDTKYEPMRRDLEGHTTDTTRDAKRKAAIHIEGATGSSIKFGDILIGNSNSEDKTQVKSLVQTGAQLPVSQAQRSRYVQHPWSSLPKPQRGSAALQDAPGSASAASTQTAVNCVSGGGNGARHADFGDVGNGGNCKNDQNALEGLLLAAAAATAGILRESSGPRSALTGFDTKELRPLNAVKSSHNQTGLEARPSPVTTNQPTRTLQVTTSASAGSCGRHSARSPNAGAAALAALATSDHIPVAPSCGAGLLQQSIGYCSGGGAGAGLAAIIHARGQHVQQQKQQPQQLPGHHRQVSEGNVEEVWRSWEPFHQSQPSVSPHAGSAVGLGPSGMARASTAHFAATTAVAPLGTGGPYGTLSAPCTGAVRSKGVLSPKVPIIMPRQFAERVMDPATILKHGITVVVRRTRPLPPGTAQPLPTPLGTTVATATATAAVISAEVEARSGRSGNGGWGSEAVGSEAAGDGGEGNGSTDLVLTAQVEQFFHAQGYSQYRVLGLKEISCGYHNWRIEMWEALGDRTVRLTICAPPQAAKASVHTQLMGPQLSTAHRDPQGSSATAAEGGGVDGSNKGGDVARALQRRPSGVVQTEVMKRELGLECTEEVGEDDFDDAGGGSASAAAAPLELESGRGANLLVAVAAAGGRSGRCNGGGSGLKSAEAGPRWKARTGVAHVSGGPYSNDGRGVAATLGIKRGAEVEAVAEAETGDASGEEPDTQTPSTATTRRSFGGSCHKILRMSTGITGIVQNNSGSGGSNKHQAQGSSQELGWVGRGDHGQESAWEAKTKPPRRMGGGWRDTTGSGGGAFGGYSSLPAEDMPPELPGALASSPHPCRKGGATVLSPDHFIHLPRLFFQDNFDTAAVLAGGLRVQVQAGTCLDPIVTTVSVASYQNHTGYRYYRLLGFKDVPRRYAGWRVAAWDKVGADMVRVRLSPPLGLPVGVALARAGQPGVEGGSTFMLSGEAAAAASKAGADASAAAADERRDYVGGSASGAGGSILPVQRRPKIETGGTAGAHCFGHLSSLLPESRSEDEEDRAAGLAMMNLGWDLQKRQPQETDTAQAGMVAVPPMHVGHTGVSDACGGGTVAAQSPRVKKILPGDPSASVKVKMGDAAAQRWTRRDGGHGGEGAASGREAGDPESDDKGDMAGTAKVGEQPLEHATVDAVTRGEDSAGVGGDPDAAGNAAGGPLAAHQWANIVGPSGGNRRSGDPTFRRTAVGHETSLPYLLLQRSNQVTASAGSNNVLRHVAPSSSEVRRIMEAGVAAAVARLEAPASRVRSVVSQNQSVVRPDKGRVYLQKPFVESSLAITATPLSVQVVINSGGELDPATYPTKVTLSSSGAHGKAEYLLRLTAPMKHAHSGQLIVGWSAIGRQQLLMHLAPPPGGRQAANSAEIGKGRIRAMTGRLPAPPLHHARAGGVTLAVMVRDGALNDGRKQHAEDGEEDGRAERTTDGGNKAYECKHEAGSNVCSAGKGGKCIAEENTAEKPVCSGSKTCVHAERQPVALHDAPLLEPMTASLRDSGTTPSISHGLVSTHGVEGARQPSAPHSSAKIVANVSSGSQADLVVRLGSTVNQSLVATADYHARLLAAGWPLAAATAVTAAAVAAATSPSKPESNTNASRALREVDQERHMRAESDGGCSPSISPKPLPAVASRRPRSSQLQRPRQGMWAHPSGPLQLVHGLPFQLQIQRHGPYHVRKPSLPDSVLNAAEQLLHLSGQALCSGSSDVGGAAACDGSGEDDDVYEHYGTNRDPPHSPIHSEIITCKGAGDVRFGWLADGEGASSEAGDSGGNTCGKLDAAEGSIKDGHDGCAEEAEATHTVPQPVTIDGGGRGCSGLSTGGGGGSDVQVNNEKVCGATEGRLVPSPKYMQSQFDVKKQQELHWQLHQHRDTQGQEQQSEPPQAPGEEAEDDWAFRRRRAALFAARRAAVGGAPPSPRCNSTDLPQQQLEQCAASEAAGGPGCDASVQIEKGRSCGAVATAGCLVHGPSVSQRANREQDPDAAQAARSDKGPTTVSDTVLRQPPRASLSAALATRYSSSAMSFDSMTPISTTASGARDSQPHGAQTAAVTAAAALLATDPGHSCQLGSQLSSPLKSLDAQQVQHLQHLHQLHEYLTGREGVRPGVVAAAAPAVNTLPALSRLGIANCSVESARKSGGSGGASSTAATVAAFISPVGPAPPPADAPLRTTQTGPSGNFEAKVACVQRVSVSRSSIDSNGGCGGLLGAMERPHAAGVPLHLPPPPMPAQQQQQEQLESHKLSTSPKQEQQERQNEQPQGMGSLATALLGRACNVSAAKANDSYAASSLKVVAAAAEALAPSAAGRATISHVAAPFSHGGDIALAAGADALSPSRRTTVEDSTLPPGLSRGICNKRPAAVALQGAGTKPLGDGDDNDGAVDDVSGFGGGDGCKNRRFRSAFCTAGPSDRRVEQELKTATRDADADMGSSVGAGDPQSGGGGCAPCKDSSCEGRKHGDRPAEQTSVAPGDRSNRPDRTSQKQPSRGVFANATAHAAVELPSACQWVAPIPMPMPMAIPPPAASALGMGMQMAALGYGLPSVIYSHPRLQHLRQQHHPHSQHHQQEEQQELEWQQSWHQHWDQQLKHQLKVVHQHQLTQIRRRELRKTEKHRRQMQKEQLQQPEQRMQHHEDFSDEVGPAAAAATAAAAAAAAAVIREEAAAGSTSQQASPRSRLIMRHQQEQQHQYDVLLKQQHHNQDLATGSLEAAALLQSLSKPRTERRCPSPSPQEGSREQGDNQQKQQDQKHLDRLSLQPTCEVLGPGRNAGASETATVPASAPTSAADSVRAQLQALLGSSAGAFSCASVPLMLLFAQQQRQQQQQQLQQQQIYHHHQQPPPQKIHHSEPSQLLQEEARKQQQQVVSSTGSEEKSMGSREGALWALHQTHAHSQEQPQLKTQPQGKGPLRAQTDQTAVVASTTATGVSEATKTDAVASADSSLAAADTAVVGWYLHHLREQFQSQQQHSEQLQERFLSQQLSFTPQQRKEQQATDSLQKQRQKQTDAHTDGEELVEHGSAATASNFHLGLADMGPALQHLMLHSRLRQQAAEWTAAAAAMAAAAMTQPRGGQPSAVHGAGPGLASPGVAFWGSGPGA